jgi:hypothetical protein
MSITLRHAGFALSLAATTGGLRTVLAPGGQQAAGCTVTLYKEQWLRLLDMSDEIRAFFAMHLQRSRSLGSMGGLVQARAQGTMVTVR